MFLAQTSRLPDLTLSIQNSFMVYTVCAAKSVDRWSILRIPLALLLALSILFAGMMFSGFLARLLDETPLEKLAFVFGYLPFLFLAFFSLIKWQSWSLRRRSQGETKYLIAKDLVTVITTDGKREYPNQGAMQLSRKFWLNRLTARLGASEIHLPARVEVLQPESPGAFVAYGLAIENQKLVLKAWSHGSRQELVETILPF